MAERQQGGRRTPRSPAPVSGPGSLSQRTDGGPQQVQPSVSGMPYGENQELEEMQSAAPLSASSSAQSPRARQRQARSTGRKAGDMGATPLMSPTQRPDEPITDGAPFGPGAGPNTLPNSKEQASRDAQMIAKYLPDLMQMAEAPDTPDGFKRFVRYLRNVSR